MAPKTGKTKPHKPKGDKKKKEEKGQSVFTLNFTVTQLQFSPADFYKFERKKKSIHYNIYQDIYTFDNLTRIKFKNFTKIFTHSTHV